MKRATKQPLTLSLSPYEVERETLSLSQMQSNALWAAAQFSGSK